jgi:archaeosine synthase beta-subunit
VSPEPSGADPRRTPAAVELGRASVGGLAGERLVVVLRAPGCAYARRTGGCTNCGFFLHLTTSGQPVSAAELADQLRAALAWAEPPVSARAGSILELDLFCSGSFLSDEEIPPEARPALLALAAAALPSLRSIVVESRPELIGRATLGPLLAALRPSTDLLEVAIGLESADDRVRLDLVRKGFTLASFERAATALAEAGVGLVAYLLLKPMGLEEEAAVEDVLSSGCFLAALGRRLAARVRIALEPVFVPEGTPLGAELLAGRYRPPSLHSVVRAARDLALSTGLPVHVGLSGEGMPTARYPSGCAACTPRLREALARFNETQSILALEGTECPECGGGR